MEHQIHERVSLIIENLRKDITTKMVRTYQMNSELQKVKDIWNKEIEGTRLKEKSTISMQLWREM